MLKSVSSSFEETNTSPSDQQYRVGRPRRTKKPTTFQQYDCQISTETDDGLFDTVRKTRKRGGGDDLGAGVKARALCKFLNKQQHDLTHQLQLEGIDLGLDEIGSLKTDVRFVDRKLLEQCQMDLALWCDECQSLNDGECPAHGPLTPVENTNPPEIMFGVKSLYTLPKGLSISQSSHRAERIGVHTLVDLDSRVRFGPIEGRLVTDNNSKSLMDSSQIWPVFLNDSVAYYIDSTNENESNWLRYISPARSADECNLTVITHAGSVYFITTRAIERGSELFYWVSPYYGEIQGIPAKPDTIKTTVCHTCQLTLLEPVCMMKHRFIFHREGLNVTSESCYLCPEEFPGPARLILHMKRHHTSRPAWKCPQCQKTFDDKELFVKHEKEYEDSYKKFSCPHCEKRFTYRPDLRNHIAAKHSALKPYICEVCNKAFAVKKILRQHVLVHNEHCKHQCTQCGKGFKDVYNLKVHCLTHTSIRPFKCIICDAAVITKQSLQVHYKRHHGMNNETMPIIKRTIPLPAPPSQPTLTRKYQNTTSHHISSHNITQTTTTQYVDEYTDTTGQDAVVLQHGDSGQTDQLVCEVVCPNIGDIQFTDAGDRLENMTTIYLSELQSDKNTSDTMGGYQPVVGTASDNGYIIAGDMYQGHSLSAVAEGGLGAVSHSPGDTGTVVLLCVSDGGVCFNEVVE